jgi:hypothetical protein
MVKKRRAHRSGMAGVEEFIGPGSVSQENQW